MSESIEISSLDSNKVLSIVDGEFSFITPSTIATSSQLCIGGHVIDDEMMEKLERLLNEERNKPTNCANCGAVLVNGKCAFCGAEY